MGGGRGVLEGLRLDGPDHQSGARQGRTGTLVRVDAELRAQLVARFGKGLDDLDVRGMPCRISPPMIALAMLPPPMNAMASGWLSMLPVMSPV